MKNTRLNKVGKFGLIVMISIFAFSSCKPGTAKKFEKGWRNISNAHKVDKINQVISSTAQTAGCSICNGNGYMYNIYQDGSWEIDAYGYPVKYTCSQCGGSGKVS